MVAARGCRAGRETSCYPYENVARTPMSLDVKWPLFTSVKTIMYPFHCRFCLVVIDYASRYCMVLPCENVKAEFIAEALISKWMPWFGLPIQIVTDNANNNYISPGIPPD